MIWACECGLRKVAPHNIPSRWRSLAYSNSPLTLAMPSTRRIDSPTPPCRRISTFNPPPRPCPRGKSRDPDDIGSPARGEGDSSSRSCPDHGGLAEVDQLSVMNHRLSLDEEMLHRARIAENQGCHRVGLRAAVCQAVGREERDIGALADLERADVVPTQARRSAPGCDPQRLTRTHRRAALACPGGEHGL